MKGKEMELNIEAIQKALTDSIADALSDEFVIMQARSRAVLQAAATLLLSEKFTKNEAIQMAEDMADEIEEHARTRWSAIPVEVEEEE